MHLLLLRRPRRQQGLLIHSRSPRRVSHPRMTCHFNEKNKGVVFLFRREGGPSLEVIQEEGIPKRNTLFLLFR
jgi:hypothetical protein